MGLLCGLRLGQNASLALNNNNNKQIATYTLISAITKWINVNNIIKYITRDLRNSNDKLHYLY